MTCSPWSEAFKPILYLAKDIAEAEDKAPDGGWTEGFIKSLLVL